MVLVSFSIARQVRSQGDPARADGSAARLPVGMMLREFACLLFTLLRRPLGNTVYFMPPYILGGEEIELLISGTKAALDEVLG